MTACASRIRSGLVLLAAVASTMTLACGTKPEAPAPGDTRGEVAALQRNQALLQRQIELAGSKAFYLVLDPATPDLALMLRGAELQRYPVLGAHVGRPRVSWFGRQTARTWQAVVWNHGTLEPLRQLDRLVIQGADPGKAETKTEAEVTPPSIPPTAEELYPVPSRYLIRFNDGLSVEIRPREADANLGRWARARAWMGARTHDVGAALWSSERDAVRLRIVLNPKDAESLYRSLPPDVRLIVL